ncbi:hypothetical protein OROMI_012440 [Orobanche minor]
MMDTDYAGSLLPSLHMEGDHDPHANYRTNPSSYLAIDGDTGQYSISYYPPKIPKGFTITPHRRFHGLRQFLVTKDDDDDAYDLVNVGTMMVQNGYAYVAGTVIYLEGPSASVFRTYIQFPPFAFKFPYKIAAGVRLEEHYEQLRKKHEDELKEIIKSDVEWTDITQPRILEFRLTWKNSISPTCSACGAELPDRVCPDCGFECLQVENAVNESDTYFGGYQSTEMQLGSGFECLQVNNVDCGMYDDQSTELQLGKAIAGHIKKALKLEMDKICTANTTINSKLEDISETIKALKLMIQEICTTDTTIKSELETARAAKREALMEVSRMAEEVLKSNRKAAHVAEQLKAVQAALATAKSELETAGADLREAVTGVGTSTEEVRKSKRKAEHVAKQQNLKVQVGPLKKRMPFGSLIADDQEHCLIDNETYNNNNNKKKKKKKKKKKQKKNVDMPRRFGVPTQQLCDILGN